MRNPELLELLWQRDQNIYILTGVALVLLFGLALAGRYRSVRHIGGSLFTVLSLLVLLAGAFEPR